MKMPPREKLVIRDSFPLPYRGGEIFGIELDALYGYDDIVQEKFLKDMETVRRPSTSAAISVNLLQTAVKKDLARCIVSNLASANKAGMRVAFIVDRHGERMLRAALRESGASFRRAFFRGYEAGKEWLIPAGLQR